MLNNEIIPIVLTTDKKFIPYTTVTLYSMCYNADEKKNYEVIIFYDDDIDLNNKIKFDYIINQFPNFRLRFINIKKYFEKYCLKSNIPHVSKATFYRYVIPDVLTEYDKVIYLDTDLVVNADVSELYEYDIENNYFIACCDSNIWQQYFLDESGHIYYTHVKKYFRDIGIDNLLENYFNAGVLVFNSKLMREDNFSQKMLENAQNNNYIHSGQDPMNVCAYGKVKFIPLNWNTMTWEPVEGSLNLLSEKYYNEYMEAVKNPKIVHYAACVKPWLYPNSFLSEYFFKYARMTPFYEQIIEEHYNLNLNSQKIKIYSDIDNIKTINDNNMTNVNNTINNILLYLAKFKQIKQRYLKYRILSSLTFGKLKQKYKEKRVKNKELYIHLKKYIGV